MAAAEIENEWKSRYREVLADLETKEREWSELEAALRRAASQLAIAAMGQDAALDGSLDEVLDLVKSSHDSGELTTSLTGLNKQLKTLESTVTLDSSAFEPTAARGDAVSFVTGLVERLGAIGPLQDALAEFEQRYRLGVAETDPARLLDGLADALGAAIDRLTRQKRELEEFLEDVTAQLGEFEMLTGWIGGDSERRRSDSLELEESVQLQIRGLHADVADVANLADLKLKVQLRLDFLAVHLREYAANEERRYEEAERRNAALKHEIAALKGKTEALTKLCGDQAEQLMFDALTEVHSRHAYELRLQEEYQRWRRHGQPLTFAIWDIDHFKAVNDKHGHHAGDRLLQLIARLLKENKRIEDFLARLGGEEFVLLLPATGVDAALEIAERLRKLIERTRFSYRGVPERISICCGLTEFRGDDTPTSVYDRADRALYEAKQAGRNRCISL